MEKNELQINNNISLEKNNTQTVNFEEQKSFLETNLGQVINAGCLLYTSPSPRDSIGSRMPSSA